MSLEKWANNVMVFNYEGFGNSEGTKSEKGVYRSVEAAYDYLVEKKGCSDESLVAYGYSLGSGAVSHLASTVQDAKGNSLDIIIDRGFSSMSQVAKDDNKTKLMKSCAETVTKAVTHFDNVNKLQNYQGNVLIVRGNADTTMSKETHAEPLEKAIGSKAKVMVVNSAHENDGVDLDEDPENYSKKVWFSSDKKGEKAKVDRSCLENFLSRKN